MLKFLLLPAAVFADATLPSFQSRSGTVQGRVEHVHSTPVDTYKGIPFAVPPTGDLRWTAPTVENSWKDVHVADTFGDACIQSSNSMTQYYPVNISEDCLYLNVYCPSRSAVTTVTTVTNATHDHAHDNNANESLPVMLFFYGGSYVYGTSSFIAYESAELVARHPNVIIVTSNYRLQALGYLGGELLREPGTNTTGNWGMLDQRAAMKWVQDNAVALGGDPTRVTIFGESAGAGSVSCHMAAPDSWPYFQQAIMESGPIAASWVSMPMAGSEQGLAQLSLTLGCSSSNSTGGQLACLRSKPAQEVYAAGRKAHPTDRGGDGVINWAPVVDGVVLPMSPHAALLKGHVHKGPVILGTNRDEGTMFVNKRHIPDIAGYKSWALDKFGPILAAKVLKMYPPSNYTSAWFAATRAFGDEAMSCPARETARLLTKAGGKAYLYFLNHVLLLVQLADPDIGVFHGTDLIYVFAKSIALWGKEDNGVSEAFGTWWTSFAHGGVPLAPNVTGHNEVWTSYDPTMDNHMDIGGGDGATSSMGDGLKTTVCDFWDANPLSAAMEDEVLESRSMEGTEWEDVSAKLSKLLKRVTRKEN